MQVYAIDEKTREALDGLMVASEEVDIAQYRGLLAESRPDAGEVVEACALYIKERKGVVELIKEEVRHMRERQRAAEYAVEMLREHVAEMMGLNDLKSVKRPLATVSLIAAKTKLVVIDVDELPAEFVKMKKEAKKTELNKYWKESGEIPSGCDTEETEAHITIR